MKYLILAVFKAPDLFVVSLDREVKIALSGLKIDSDRLREVRCNIEARPYGRWWPNLKFDLES